VSSRRSEIVSTGGHKAPGRAVGEGSLTLLALRARPGSASEPFPTYPALWIVPTGLRCTDCGGMPFAGFHDVALPIIDGGMFT
jgi:hypothetical protein